MYKKYFKRILDLIVSVLLFIILSPLFLIICIISFFVMDAAPFFFQLRPGKHAKIFRLIKFKTMNDQKDKDGNLLPDAERLTRFGAFLRRTSLDEIPQLLNVIKGDMSLVGPRPLLVEYLPLYNATQARRHEVLPGITGWAQVNGRNAINWQKKFAYDVWYVDHISFITDMKIILTTFKKVIRKEGINSATLVTMEKFTGN